MLLSRYLVHRKGSRKTYVVVRLDGDDDQSVEKIKREAVRLFRREGKEIALDDLEIHEC